MEQSKRAQWLERINKLAETKDRNLSYKDVQDDDGKVPLCYIIAASCWECDFYKDCPIPVPDHHGKSSECPEDLFF